MCFPPRAKPRRASCAAQGAGVARPGDGCQGRDAWRPLEALASLFSVVIKLEDASPLC